MLKMLLISDRLLVSAIFGCFISVIGISVKSPIGASLLLSLYFMENEVRSAIVEREAKRGVNHHLAAVAISIIMPPMLAACIELTINYFFM